jgi:hypothetical protein
MFHLVRGMMRIRFVTGNYKCLKLGQCAIYGPREFLEIASKAMGALYTLDRTLYESLISKKFVFWYEPVGPMFFRRHGGISKGYYKWKDYGILACIIYTYFTNQLFYDGRRPPYEPKEVGSLSQEVYTRVRSWLEEKQFPAQLVRCFAPGHVNK